MRRKLVVVFVMCITLCTVRNAFGQESFQSIYQVADHIIESTSFKLVNSETGELYTSTDNLELSPVFKIESPYNEWKYWNGVLALGMIELGKVSGNAKYIEYASDNYNFIFDNLDYFEKQYEKNYKKSSFYLYFRMSRLDDCGAMATGLYEVYKTDPRNEFLNYFERVADFIENEEVRMEDKTIVRPKPRKMTLWADDLYMSVPFLVRMAQLSGEQKYLEDAITQVKNFNKYLYNEENQLYFHSWYSDNNQNGVAHWGRCNGWVLMAQVELLNYLPENHPDKEYLIDILEDHIVGLSRHQLFSSPGLSIPR